MNDSAPAPTRVETDDDTSPGRRCMRWADAWWPTIALILGVTALRLAYLAWMSPYALAEDEAHYWEWSRRLDLSYYSKGPGIAWTIALGTRLFGDTEFGVRFFAPIFGAVLAGAAAAMAYLGSGDRRAALLGAGIVLLTPVFQISSGIMTIDGPFVAMWALAGLGAFGALRAGSRIAWPALGGAIAIGFLYKYTILLIVPGLTLYALVDRRRLRLAPRAGAWALLGTGVAALGLLPVLIWNAGHDWVTVRHLLGHLGVAGGDVPPRPGEEPKGYSPLWTLEYLGLQIAVAGPAVLLGLATLVTRWRRHARDPDQSTSAALLLGLASVPVLLFYLGVTGFTKVEANWPVAAYATLAPLAAIGLLEGLIAQRAAREAWLARPSPRPRRGLLRRGPERPALVLWHWTIGYGLVTGLLMARLDLLHWLPGADMAGKRLTRAHPTAQAAQRELERLRALNGANGAGEPFLAAGHYGQASLMAFYLPGHPIVYCASAVAPGIPELGLHRGRESQYDHWPMTDLRNPETIERLAGRPAVLVGGALDRWRTGFERVRELPPHPREDVPPILIGRGFAGFPPHDDRAGDE